MSGAYSVFPLQIVVVSYSVRTANPLICVTVIGGVLRRCSDNLNQYAKRANETGSIYAADIEDLQNRLDEIWELSRQSLFTHCFLLPPIANKINRF